MNDQVVKLEQFAESFSAGLGTIRLCCNCGMTYYTETQPVQFDEEEYSELQELEIRKKATPVSYSITVLEFEGNQYAENCSCWHERATQIMGFIDSHKYKIALYFKLEKKRLQKKADDFPTIETEP